MSIEKKLDGKVIVVTGAGGTLCSAMAIRLAERGARVVLLGRTAEKLEPVARRITAAGGSALSYGVDVTDERGLEQVAASVVAAWGGIWGLVNGAGGNQTEAITTVNEFVPEELSGGVEGLKGFFNLQMKSFQDVLVTNTMGTVKPSYIFGKEMAKAGSGSIVNIASMNSYRPLSRVGAYGMAKAGVVSFTQWLASYLAPAGIRVNAIAPGFFLNDRSRARLLDGEGGFTPRGQNIINHTPMRRFGEAPELLGALEWLMDEDAAAFVSGITIPVDGGFLSCSGV